MTSRLLLVRHRQSTWNAERRWTGQADPPLTPLGEQQAAAMGAALADVPFDAVVASDLTRAVRTAEIVAAALGVPLAAPDPRLRELDLPAWTGRTKDEIEAAEPGALERWRDGVPRTPPGSEPWAAVERRVLAALDDCARSRPSTLVVAHSGVLRVLRTALASPHGRVGRSRGVWVEWHDGAPRVGGLQRLRG